MHTLPAAFEERIKKQLPGEADSFLQAIQTEPPVSIRLNPGKFDSPDKLFPDFSLQTVPWCENAWYLNKRPVFTLDPCFHGGAYYVQEASSMFLHHILKQILPAYPIRALDLCAAPGGKSTLMAACLKEESLLVSNEIIRIRASILKENIIKWGHDNIVVTNNDPADFKDMEGAFDLILVDAPCSGEGMFRKDKDAIQEWSENNLRLCSERQQRILANIWNCLKPDGILIYSTCTYNPQENEAILEWLMDEYKARSVEINHTFASITTGLSKAYCYHFYPHKTRGEGFFIGVLRKEEGKEFSLRKSKRQNQEKPVQLPQYLESLIQRPGQYSGYLNQNTMGIIPVNHADFINYLDQNLHVLYKGCEIAEVNNRKIKLLPPSALWLGLDKNNCSVFETDRKTALSFLRKDDISAPPLSGEWILISHQHTGLGWCKNLGTRLNNYYPKEWRIRMRVEGL